MRLFDLYSFEWFGYFRRIKTESYAIKITKFSFILVVILVQFGAGLLALVGILNPVPDTVNPFSQDFAKSALSLLSLNSYLVNKLRDRFFQSLHYDFV
ncbi:hypothetical protein LPTSP3_g09590 [Leptospira kobayashii]|uniref:Uncharacterized protein n=1 Tax=Leptospira kobayashii TaxID=1917830 RepID=A0ABM7UHM7_9LEPT|nr:hypothetical protein LPTSP3_g09590 [Leptospira kobayashii]